MEEFIYLDDNRRLGYKEYGDINGFPVIALHRTPGSRIWFKSNDSISTKLGIRLITVDRPGYGLSSIKAKRTILDLNEDLDCLIKELKINQFSIFGVSGGGVYALVYASSQNPTLHKTALVASIFEFENGKIPKEMCRPNRIAFCLARRAPWILRFSFNQQRSLLNKNRELYSSSIQKNVGHLCESDQKILQDVEVIETNILHFAEAYKVNANEAVNELSLFSKNWGFKLNKIKSPVEIWHGIEDTLSPIKGLKAFIGNIPNSNTHYLEGKGHFLDEDLEVWEQILRSLIP